MVKRYLTLIFFVVCDILSVVLSLGVSLTLTGESFYNIQNRLIGLSYLLLVFSVVVFFYLFIKYCNNTNKSYYCYY